MNEPTKKEMLECVEFLTHAPGWRPLGWDKEIKAIRALIEAMPEPGQKPKVTREQFREASRYVGTVNLFDILYILGLELETEKPAIPDKASEGLG